MADSSTKILPQPSLSDSPNIQICGVPSTAKDPNANGIYEPKSYDYIKADKYILDCCNQSGKQLWVFDPKNSSRTYTLSYMNAKVMADYDKPSGWQLSAIFTEAGKDEKHQLIAYACGESDFPPANGWKEIADPYSKPFSSLKVVGIENTLQSKTKQELRKEVDPDAYLKGYMDSVNVLVRDREIDYQTHEEEQSLMKLMEKCIASTIHGAEENLCSLQMQLSLLRQGDSIGELETGIMVTMEKTIASLQQSIESKKKRLMQVQEHIQAKEEDMTKAMKVLHATKLSFGPQLSGGQIMPPPSPTITSFTKQVDFPFFKEIRI